jgi:hypothetical protein
MKLTDRTQSLISLIDDAKIRAEVKALFEKEGALYGPPTTDVLERVRFSVLKLAMQGPKRFLLAAKLYSADTRDLLVSADFANDLNAHQKWCESILKNQ